jgi:predicted Fe-Mo cluster-binding NifX family protein
MRIAVASKTGIEVDQHFGHAERFLIYDFNQGLPRRVDEVQVEKYCSFDPEHPFRHRQFDAIVEALKGCRAVVTAMIGPLPKQELQKAGIEAVSTEGPIEEALRFAHAALCGCGGQGPKKCSRSMSDCSD